MDGAWDLFEFAWFLVGMSLFVVVPIWAAATLHTTRRRKVMYGAGGVALSLGWLALVIWLIFR